MLGLAAENLSCERGNRRLFSRLNFALTSGEIVHITGPNGCGKSSLLRQLAGLLPLQRGRISWQGMEINSNYQYRRELLYIGHAIGLKSHLTVMENLLRWAALAGLPHNYLMPTILTTFGLNSIADTYGKCLSSGQQHKVSLTRLIFLPAKLWILDEPFTSLDVTGIATLHNLMQQHQQQGGSIILASHQVLPISGVKCINLAD